MTTYYVRKTGDDDNTGLSAALAWLTIDKAASTMQAGDTVYIGAGAYQELVTIDYSGSLGSLISYIADIDGSKTGDPGLVFITAHDTVFVADRDNCLVLVDKTHLFFQDICFVGGLSTSGSVSLSSTTGASYDCIEFNGCSMICTSSANYSRAITVDYGTGVSPTTTGLRLNYCVIVGGLNIRFDEQTTAVVEVDFLAYKCIFEEGATETGSSLVRFARDTDSTYALSGFIFDSCEFIGAEYVISASTLASGANGVIVRRSIIRGIGSYLGYGTSNYNILFEDNFIFSYNTSLYATFVGLNRFNYVGRVMGGLVDFPLYRKFGYSPYRPRENIAFIDTKPMASLVSSPDIYGNPSGNSGEVDILVKGTITDPNSVWTNEANIMDDDTVSYGYATALGSSSSNYIQIVLDYPYKDNQLEDVEISSMTLKIIAQATHSSVSFSGDIYTSGRASLISSIDEVFPGVSPVSIDTELDLPSGFKLSDLNDAEIRIWKSAGSTSYTLRILYIYIRATIAASSTVGPVSDKRSVTRNTLIKHAGSSSICISGTGYQEFFVPVAASETTFSVYARYDSSYVEGSGYLPKLEVFNIPGANDASDEMTSSADTWEQLSVTFTPASSGIVRVRLSGFDISGVGKTYFDDMDRT